MTYSIYRTFGDFFDTLNSADFQDLGKTLRNQLNVRMDTKDMLTTVEVEVPGVDPKDIKIKIEGRLLTVNTPRGNAYVPIGQRVRASDATSSLKHGLLTIKIPTRGADTFEIPVSTD